MINKYKYKDLINGITLFLAVVFFSCNENKSTRNIERSFYYWKSVFKWNDFERQRLDSLHVQTLYVKFFDVDWDEVAKIPVPVAPLQDAGYTLQGNMQIIPTVFITNACIQKTDSAQLITLATDILGMIKKITGSNHFPPLLQEIQIDCDWTASTQEKYFKLLRAIKQQSGIATLSATIRLHQVKFLSKTGVPPVDKGLLMCYNMGNLKNPATKNSILETAALKKYIANLSIYPLPLDVALPLFEWKVLFRNNAYSGLIQNLPGSVFTNAFTIKKDNRIELLQDTLLQGYDLKKGDIVRTEESTYKEIIATAEAVNAQLKNTHVRVALYHMDSVILSKYTLHELEDIYNSMR
jgi:hypothetical protein